MTEAVLCVAAGTRGDAEPLANWAKAAAARGYRLFWASVPSLIPWGRNAGLETIELPEGASELYSEAPYRSAGGAVGSFWSSLSSTISFVRTARERYACVARAFARTLCDVRDSNPERGLTVVLGGLSVFWLYPIVRAYGAKTIFACFQPIFPTRAFNHPLAPSWVPKIPGLSWSLVRTATWWPWKSCLRRVELGGVRPYADRRNPWTRLERERVLWLVPIPETVLPRPRDWPERVVQTSSWILGRSTALAPELLRRVERARAESKPIVYVGFGSGTMLYENLWKPIETIGRDLGVEFVTQVKGDWNHAQLFPLCDAAIHHGGAGTFSQALRSGIPQAAIWSASDSAFWASRIAQLGLGPLGCAGSKGDERTLKPIVAALVSNPAYRENAVRLAAITPFGCETSVDAAIRWWERDDVRIDRPEAPENRRAEDRAYRRSKAPR